MVYCILGILQEWTTAARVLSCSLACVADKFPLPLLTLAMQATWSLEQTTCENDVLLQGMLLGRPPEISLKDFYIVRKHNTRFNSHHYFISELLFKQALLPTSCYVVENISTIFNRLWHPNISSYFLVVSASLDQTWLHKKSPLWVSISHGLTSSESQYNHYLKTINMSFPKTFVCLWFELKKYIVLKNEPNI